MIKNFEAKSENETISDEDLALINRQSLKKLNADEVFVFSVILCDNEIDRDFEVFSDNALLSLEKLFVGKTGILNHSNRSEDQQSRTYKTELIEDRGRTTSYGEAYKYLKAWCYTVRSPKNENLIKDIEGGIKKEVSISCNFAEKVCSVCGESVCNHKKGKYYGDTLCYKTIDGVTDAYEWSFVAVPAQRQAGVTKSNSKKYDAKENLRKSNAEKELNLARQFKNEMILRAQKGFSLHFPELSSDTAESIIRLCPVEELSELVKAFERKTAKSFPIKSQFGEASSNNNTNSYYKF